MFIYSIASERAEHRLLKARRRKANKVARVSRRINRWKQKGKL